MLFRILEFYRKITILLKGGHLGGHLGGQKRVFRLIIEV